MYYSAAAAKSLQSCLTLCDPRDSSPPGSPIPGILQARTVVWVVISFSIIIPGDIKKKKKNIAEVYAKEWSAYVSLQAFYSIGLTFRSLTHFAFVLLYGVREYFNFILLHVTVKFSQHHLLKRIFLHFILFSSL